MSNKKNGTNFEEEFCIMAQKKGFWAHRLRDGKNGQPADVIISKNNTAFLIECKVCEKEVFKFSRIEENQELAMRAWMKSGNGYAYFALKIGDEVRVIHYNLMMILKSYAVKQLTKAQIFYHSAPFDEFVYRFMVGDLK